MADNKDSFLAKFQYPNSKIEKKIIMKLDAKIKENDLNAILAKWTLLMSSINFSPEAPYASQYIAYLKKIPVTNCERANFIINKLKKLSEEGSIQATRILVDLYENGEGEILKMESDPAKQKQYSDHLKRLKFAKNKEIIILLEKASILGDLKSSEILYKLHKKENILGYPELSVFAGALKSDECWLWYKINQGNVMALLDLADNYLKRDLFLEIATETKSASDKRLCLQRLISLLQNTGQLKQIDPNLKKAVNDRLLKLVHSLPQTGWATLFSAKLNCSIDVYPQEQFQTAVSSY